MNKSTIIITIIAVIILVGIFLFSGDNVQKEAGMTDNAPDISVDVSEDQPMENIEDKVEEQVEEQAANRQSGLKIEIVTEGSGPEIENGRTAVVHYIGKLTDGTVFDSSVSRGETFSFTLGAGQVIKGWDRGVQGMKVGEKRILTIPSHLAYGENGIPGVIPPNATLVFDVELIEIR